MHGWILVTQWLARFVLLLLVVLSVWSVSIMIERRRFFRSLNEGTDLAKARELIRSNRRSELLTWAASSPGLSSGMLRAALELPNPTPETVDRAVRSYLIDARERLENGLTVLATLGSNAPFIGLFGTVLGIIQAFGELSTQEKGTQAVVGGISEALVATAVGLFVAIPAVVAYNYFQKKVRTALTDCESLRDYFLSREIGTKS